jgi:hypothetical protein
MTSDQHVGSIDRVAMFLSSDSVVGVDTPEDLRKAEQLMKTDLLFPEYGSPNT